MLRSDDLRRDAWRAAAGYDAGFKHAAPVLHRVELHGMALEAQRGRVGCWLVRLGWHGGDGWAMTNHQVRALMYGIMFLMVAAYWQFIGCALFLTMMDFVEGER